MRTGTLVLSIILLIAVAVVVVVSWLGKPVPVRLRTPAENAAVIFAGWKQDDWTEVPPPDDDVALLELYMLTAIARGDAALAAYVQTRNEQQLLDGVLDMRNRLAQGLDMPADELAARLDEERQRTP